jgi:predicted DNA-binding protein
MREAVKRRTNLYIREDQMKRLKIIGRMKASSTAELVRQAIDDYLEKVEAKIMSKKKHKS